MEEKSAIVLENREAREAICADFRQYDPQIMLFAEIIPLITEGRMRLKREIGKIGAWIRQAGRRNMRWEDGAQLVETTCKAVETADISIELLAAICGRVFRTKTAAVQSPTSDHWLVRIETGMERFSCRHCGMCCRALDYSKEVTSADMARWRDEDRQDILKWVGRTQTPDGETRYRIWIVPGTNRAVATCPFLVKDRSTHHWLCRIHDVKPEVCRQFPFSKKHALMTGCKGFERNKTE